MIREVQFKPRFEDDLYFDHSKPYFNGGIQNVVEHYKKNADLDLAPVNAAYLMYNIALAGLYEPLIFEEVERHMHKYEDQLRGRWAFGCLYGVYKTNAGTRAGLEFFQNELIKRVHEITMTEMTELCDAICYCTLMTHKEKIRLIQDHFVPIITSQWKSVKNNKKVHFGFLRPFYELKFFPQEVWDPLLESLRTSKNMSQHDWIAETYELLHKLKEVDFYRDVSDDIAFWADKINKHEDMAYRYSTEFARWYTFQELKAKRDEIRYPDQMLRTHVEELTEEEKQKRAEAEAQVEAERKQVEREKNLTSLVAERYMQFMRGDTEMMYQGLDRDEGEFEKDEELEEVDLDELERTAGSQKEKLTEAERRKKQKEDLAKQKKVHKLLARQLGAEMGKKKDKEDEDDDGHEPVDIADASDDE